MKNIFVLCVILFINSMSFAQVNFSGTWIMKEKQHIQGPEYDNALPNHFKVDQQKDSLCIEVSSIGKEGGYVMNRLAVAMNGHSTETISPSSKRRIVRNISWSADKKSLKLTAIFYMPEDGTKVDFTRIEIWMLSADEHQIKVNKKSIETRSETWEVDGTFEKQ